MLSVSSMKKCFLIVTFQYSILLTLKNRKYLDIEINFIFPLKKKENFIGMKTVQKYHATSNKNQLLINYFIIKFYY